MKTFFSTLIIILFSFNGYAQFCQNIKTPDAPPFTEAEIQFPEKDYFEWKKKEKEDKEYFCGCTDIYQLTGYILKVNEKGREGKPSICFRDRAGRIHDLAFAMDDLCNATRSWLPYVFVPGNKVQVSVYSCGNGGYEKIVRIKNLKRND
jgi:hypothetical protein